MSNWLLVPPIAFMLILLVSILMTLVSSTLSFKGAKDCPGKLKSYGCGEDVPNPRLQPDYTQFFAFAFFFTVMHVIALIVATAPAGTMQIAGVAALYFLCALSGLFILFRK